MIELLESLIVEIMANSQFGIVYCIVCSVNTKPGHRVKGGGMEKIDGKSDLVQ